ncbi:MAG: hypothetical protein NTW93_02045 [Phycisphaerae bacterium]|nr:hypothetical protein [Phycisphaerae bacterium]
MACPCPPLPPCYHQTSGYPTCGTAWNCSDGQFCCNGSCCGPGGCQSCSGGSCVVCDGDPNKTCCNGSCCNNLSCEDCNNGSCESRCRPENCAECDGSGSCVVCDGDPNKTCCNGSCCNNLSCEDCNNGQCESRCRPENCAECDGQGHCKVCNDDPHKFCCEGSCCNCENCDMCKNGSCVPAKPTNLHCVYVQDLGDGRLYFRYEWDSTTGDLGDLGNSAVREKVDYPGGSPYYWPSPPWIGWVPNPTIAPNPPIPGTYGLMSDTHSPPGFTTPYQTASVTAMQVYQYICGCKEDWDTLLSIGPIYRFVTQDGPYWRYSILKSGAYAEIFPLP